VRRFGLQTPLLRHIFAFDPALSNDNEFISQPMVTRIGGYTRPAIGVESASGGHA
jgi:hypothetical protein